MARPRVLFLAIAALAMTLGAARSAHAGGAVIHVPADHATIQGAINAAASGGGDEIVVALGTYNEAIDFLGKAVTLRSSDPLDPKVVAATIIDGTGINASVVKCISGETSATVLDGFTVTGGHYGTPDGGCPTHYGLGMYIKASSPTVQNCIFRDNTSPGTIVVRGGGVAVRNNSNPTFTNCQFNHNSVGLAGCLGFVAMGGGMSNESNSHSSLFSCSFSGNFDNDYGGGIRSWHGNLTLSDCSFTANHARYGGGISAEADADNTNSNTIENCFFSNNSAIVDGGGLLINVTTTVTTCTFDANSAGNGGGVLIHGSGSSTITITTECTFTNNSTVFGGGGGGMAINGSGTHTVQDCTFQDNYAQGYGGGIKVQNGGSPHGQLQVLNCTFDGNDSAVVGGGISVLVLYTPYPLVRDCIFSGNTGTFGGAVAIQSSSGKIVNCLMTGNSAAEHGGGVCLFGSGGSERVEIANCTIVGNTVETAGRGAGVENAGPSSSVPVAISNCIIRDNIGGPNVKFKNELHPGQVMLEHSNVQGDVPGYHIAKNNIDADAMFVDAKNGDYRLSAGSPCIDAGNHWALPSEVESDRDGMPRILDGTGDSVAWVDMGAFEYQGQEAPIGQFPQPIAVWNFNEFDPQSASIPADHGQGTIDLSNWGGAVEVGTGANLGMNAHESDPPGTSLRLPSDINGNGTYLQFSFSMLGRQNLGVSFVTDRVHNNTFSSGTWSWSIDGDNFITLPGANTCAHAITGNWSLQVVNLAAVKELNDAEAVMLRYTLDGAVGSEGYVEIDNVQLIEVEPEIIEPLPPGVIYDTSAMIEDQAYGSRHYSMIGWNLSLTSLRDKQVADDFALINDDQIARVTADFTSSSQVFEGEGIWVEIIPDAGGKPAEVWLFRHFFPIGDPRLTITDFVDGVFGTFGHRYSINVSDFDLSLDAGTWWLSIQPEDIAAPYTPNHEWLQMPYVQSGFPAHNRNSGADHGNNYPSGGGCGGGDWVLICGVGPKGNLSMKIETVLQVPGDITGDGVVNVSDLLAVINAWGACPAPPALCLADVTGDGQVNVSDLLMVINNWS